jgi:oligoribonuclease
LAAASLNSTIDVQQAEQELLTMLKAHVPPKRCPLAGQSVYLDRVFLSKYMPSVDDYLHYRHVDVTSLIEAAKR